MLKGFSLIEVIIAIGLFVILMAGGAGIINLNHNSMRLAFEYDQAYAYLNEGIDITRNIKKSDWSDLQNGTHGLSENAGSYEFSGSSDTWGKYTREIVISDAYRDGDGNLDPSDSGTLDENVKKITVNVSWDYSLVQAKSIRKTFYLTNWSLPII